MDGTIKYVLTLLYLFAWSINAQQTDIVLVPASSTRVIISQNGSPLSQSYLSSQGYAGRYYDCGGGMLLNSTIDTEATLLFNGTSIYIEYGVSSTGGNAAIYLDGIYQETISSYADVSSCAIRNTTITNLTPETHSIMVVNLSVLTLTALSGFTYITFTDTTPTTVVPSSQSTSTRVSHSTLAPQYTSTTTIIPSHSKASIGPIIGGVVAGVVALIILILSIVFVIRRRSRQANPPVSAGLDAAAPETYGQEPKNQAFTPHDPSTLPHSGYSSQFPNTSPNVAPIISAYPPPISNSSRTDQAMSYGSNPPLFLANGKDTPTSGHDQNRLSIGSSPSLASHTYQTSPSSPRALPLTPIPQYPDQVQQQQQQYWPESRATRPTSDLSQADLVQQLVSTGVPAAEVVRMMGEVASGSSSRGAGGHPVNRVDEQPPPSYDDKGGI